jgi:hypothetical protein
MSDGFGTVVEIAEAIACLKRVSDLAMMPFERSKASQFKREKGR